MATVTAPVAMLSVAPALADTKPAAQTQNKPSIAELEQAVKDAQKAFDDAVVAEKALTQSLTDTQAPTYPLLAAFNAAHKAAGEAESKKSAADKAVTETKAKLAAAVSDEDKTAAQQALTEAEASAKDAADAKSTADKTAADASKALSDARVEISKKIYAAQELIKSNRAKKTAAEKALADAKKEAGEGDCVPTGGLTAAAVGLPSKIPAGATVDFTLHLANTTGRTLDQVIPTAYAHATDKSGTKDLDGLLHVQWSNGSGWHDIDGQHRAGTVKALRTGALTDVKLRLTLGAQAPADGTGVVFINASYTNNDGTCGGVPDAGMYPFQITAAGSKPSTEPSKPTATSTPAAQSSKSPAPVGATSGAGDSGSSSGSLAKTGSSSAVPQLALGGGAAIVLGAGAVFVVRRRKAADNA
ncbi:LPXTG cell wall anchor domain-containing protein [Streptomyces sp. NBC_00083]|uniref:LPXTG cell wall anchor domain-containing protein n=1 Tax=Streptomyces sp. NBC_00083 TaxID=2975647 RepID=UPI0022597A86|nr:LPXTG cell wall anchor domain-containing protein [Streptomyces sp. NBC_00083]MCX5384738.1 LPXTG cell wall anchor domain-containing protein [Streptomyces sp. NBC_00083]